MKLLKRSFPTMKHDHVTLLIGMILLCTPLISSGQLSGTYTLGAGGDYATFSAAAADLNTLGVNGPVTFNVLSGTYTEQFTLDNIPGAGGNNPVTFQSASGDSTDVVVQYGADNTNNYVMLLDSVRYVTFRSMTFLATDDVYARVVVFTGVTDHVTFTHCVFQGSYYPYGDMNRVLLYSTGRMKSLIIDHNIFSQSSYGISFQGATNDTIQPEISDNTFDSLSYTAIYLYAASAPVVTGNTITHCDNGIWISMSKDNANVSSNNIDVPLTGIQLNYFSSTAGHEALISNNMIAVNRADVVNPGNGGIYLANSNHIKVYYNTSVFYIHHYDASKALNIKNCEGSSVEVVNNNLVCLHDGNALYADQNTGVLGRCDYNNFYSAGNVLAVWNGTDCADLAVLKSTSGDNEHSVSADPQFLSDTDLHVNAAALDSAGVPVPGITQDIDGDLRDPQYPDIGADEFGAVPVSHPPVAVNDTVEAMQGGGVFIPVLANDSDPDGDPIHVSAVGTPAQGQITSGVRDTLRYLTPMTEFTGMDSVIYYIQDTTGREDSAWIFILVTPYQNRPPVAVNDTASVVQGASVKVYVLDNDSDPDHDPISVAGVLPPVHGTAGYTDMYVTYHAPAGGFIGIDSLQYLLQDSGGLKDTAWIFVTVREMPFTDAAIVLDSFSQGSCLWADYDMDGDMDILAGGVSEGNVYQVKLYRNDNGSFTTSAVITGINLAQFDAAAWGDFDNDGDPDLIVSGYENSGLVRTPRTRLFRNDDGQLHEIVSGINMNNAGSVDWGDYDNDGDMDLLTGGDATAVYRNDGPGEAGMWVFTQVMALPAAREGSAKWGDYDGDGDMDILLSTTRTGETKIRLYRNDGDGNFQEINTGIEGTRGRCVWYDYNGDGYPDILFAGRRNDTLATLVYRNDAGTTGRIFTDIHAGLTGLEAGSLSLCDYDLDGDADLLVTGKDGSGKCWTLLYDYTGNDRFAGAGIDLPGVDFGNGTWGDYNGDGTPDLLLTGYRYDPATPATSGPYSGVFTNNTTAANTPPTGITGLSETVDGTTVTLSWNPATDRQSQARALTYNLRIGTTQGGSEIMSSLADASDGRLYVPGTGNIGYQLQWTVHGLQLGRNYYWSVQAVDPAFAAAAFAEERSFRMESGYFSENPLSVPEGLSYGDVAWGDYDNDGDLDLVISGKDGDGTPVTRIYKNNNGNFTDIEAPLQGVWRSSVAWGDYDGDGDLDLVVGGYASEEVTSGKTVLYRNDGNDVFTDIQATLINTGDGDVMWLDYDNDGDLDLLITGKYTEQISVAKIFRNDDGVFHLDAEVSMTGVYESSADVYDYDNDGDMDILLSGINETEGLVTKIFINQGGVFMEDPNVSLPAVSGGGVAWGDYNNDGRVDILLSGVRGYQGPMTAVLRNKGHDTFEDIGAGLNDEVPARVAWGDIDMDGTPDAVVANAAGVFVYLNKPGGFEEVLHLPGLANGAVALGDYNGDRRLDLVLTGEDNNLIPYTKIYYNRYDGAPANLAPDVPEGLVAYNEGDGIVFQWESVGDRDTPRPGMSYNLRIGTSPGGSEVMPSMSDAASGLRRIARTGNAGQNLTWKITGLESDQTYYWSVQSVDAGYLASAFAGEQSISWEPSYTVSGDILLYLDVPANMTTVWALSINDEGYVSNIVSADLTGTNRYEIHGVPEGMTTIQVFPVTGAYPDYLPTYLGSTIEFNNADKFVLDRDTTVENIYLVHRPENNHGGVVMVGSISCSCDYGECEGCKAYIHLSEFKSVNTDTTFLEGVYVYLFDENGDVANYSVTDSLGKFTMDSILYGKYTLGIDVVGLPIISNKDTIVFSEDSPEYRVEAEVGDTAITVTFLEVTAVEYPDVDPGISVFPNPVQEVLYLRFDRPAGGDVRIRFIRMDGRVCQQVKLGHVEAGGVYSVPVSDLPAGMYILSVEGKGINVKVRVVKEER